MKALTLKLREPEMNVIEDLAERKGLSKTALIRQALRVYQVIDERLENGDKLFIEAINKDKAELLLL